MSHSPQPDPAPLPPTAAKAALRSRIKSALAATTPPQRAAWSAAIVARIATLPEYAASHTILLYAPMHSAGEVDLLPLARTALAAGKTVVFPRVDWSGPAPTMFCAAIADPDRDLIALPNRPAQPRPDFPTIPVSSLDLVLVPGLAFDRRGGRLGRGGGFYDRLLADPALRARTLAPAFEVQVVPEVPMEPHDQRVHAVVTP